MLIVVNRSGVIDKNVYSFEFPNEQLYQISSFFFVSQIRLEDFRLSVFAAHLFEKLYRFLFVYEVMQAETSAVFGEQFYYLRTHAAARTRYENSFSFYVFKHHFTLLR